MKLKRASDETAAEARQGFLDFFAREGRRHFRIEEELLLPAYARHGDATEDDVVRVLTDHVELRRAATDLTTERDELRRLGERLEAHIRHEERVLFPRIEAALSDEELIQLGAEIERAEASG